MLPAQLTGSWKLAGEHSETFSNHKVTYFLHGNKQS